MSNLFLEQLQKIDSVIEDEKIHIEVAQQQIEQLQASIEVAQQHARSLQIDIEEQ